MPDQPDLRLVLQTTLHSLIAPDFDSYHNFLSERGALLGTMLTAQCRSMRNKINFGYTDTDWERLTDVEKARVFWNSVDIRGARWNSVELDGVKAGSGYMSLEPPTAGRICAFAVYRAPGGTEFHNDCIKGLTPVAWVRVPIQVKRGKALFIFCFGFDSSVGKWYPFCVVNDHDDNGPNCNLRI